MDSDAADFFGGMRAVGVAAKHPRVALLTHWHSNHTAGATFLKREIPRCVISATK
jgi:metal-dependent hydrolase (beta-lactamase superfamily II)